jgi:hypothetical protein
MDTAQECRRYAEQVERLADVAALDYEHQLTVLKIAAAWRDLANHLENPPAANRLPVSLLTAMRSVVGKALAKSGAPRRSRSPY